MNINNKPQLAIVMVAGASVAVTLNHLRVKRNKRRKHIEDMAYLAESLSNFTKLTPLTRQRIVENYFNNDPFSVTHTLIQTDLEFESIVRHFND